MTVLQRPLTRRLSVLAGSVCAPMAVYLLFSLRSPPPPTPARVPYTALFRSCSVCVAPRLCSPATQPGRSIRTQRAQFARSEEHTSELQSRFDLVCRLLLEKKKTPWSPSTPPNPPPNTTPRNSTPPSSRTAPS